MKNLIVLMSACVLGIFATPCALAEKSDDVALKGKKMFLGETRFNLVAPNPFVEVAAMYPDQFEVYKRTGPDGNRLLAWFIPYKNIGFGKVSNRYPSLQIAIDSNSAEREISPAEVDKFFRDVRARARLGAHDLPGVENLLSEIFEREGHPEMKVEARLLGIVRQDSTSICHASLVTGSIDGNLVNGPRLVLATVVLVKKRLLYLYLTGSDASKEELSKMREIEAEWVSLLHQTNPD